MPAAEVFQLLDREIWIVTAAAGGRRGGLVATGVMQASIDPENPLVVVALATNHFTRSLVDSSGAFALHLLRGDQAEVALRFALTSGRDQDKLAGLSHTFGETRSPRLTDSLAWLECRVVDCYVGGERNYYWAKVIEEQVVQPGTPLRESALLAAAQPEQRDQLRASREADVHLQRPLLQQWLALRDHLGGS